MPLDPPRVLLRKAQDDERLAGLVADNATVSDEQIGFLSQQAIEKCVKAVLSLRGIRYRRTHDLGEMIDLLKANDIAYPPAMDDSIGLTPFAAEMRYDYLPPEEGAEESFDRANALRLVRTAIEWAEGIISEKPDEPPQG
jgi:HEPN domain-containing protein